MNDKFNLNRFIIQQNKYYDLALRELKSGKKKKNWMFFIFPQIQGLGHSPYDTEFSIKSLEEAQSYLKNQILYSHLNELIQILLKNKTNKITDIFDFPDYLKLKSSMTLFHFADPNNQIFQQILDKFYNGEKDENTIKFLNNNHNHNNINNHNNNNHNNNINNNPSKNVTPNVTPTGNNTNDINNNNNINKEEFPYVICNMISSIDGKVTGDFFEEKACEEGLIQFYKFHRELNANAFCCGKNTMNLSFIENNRNEIELKKYKNPQIKIGKDFIYKLDYTHFAVAFDSKGTLLWKNSHIIDEDSGFDKSHIVEVLTENVNNEYLCYLQEIKVSYIFAGKDKIDLKIALKKLKKIFEINVLVLEGGSLLNESFLNEDLIDEINLFIVPLTGGKDSKSLFNNGDVRQFKLNKTTLFEGGVVNLNYIRK